MTRASTRTSVWIAAGWLAVGLAITGLVVPGLPATVFALAAFGCFSKGSPRLASWVSGHPQLGPLVREFATDHGLSRSTKRSALLAMWGSILISAVLLRDAHVAAVAGTIGMGVVGSATVILGFRTVAQKAELDSPRGRSRR